MIGRIDFFSGNQAFAVHKTIGIFNWNRLTIGTWRVVSHANISGHDSENMPRLVDQATSAKSASALKANLNKSLVLLVIGWECFNRPHVKDYGAISLWKSWITDRSNFLANLR